MQTTKRIRSFRRRLSGDGRAAARLIHPLARLGLLAALLGSVCGCTDEPERSTAPPEPGGTVLDERCPPEMIFIPAATFEAGLAGGRDDELPVREASVEPFCISRTEITHGMFARCVDAGFCPEPFFLPEFDPDSWNRKCLWGYVREGLTEDPWHEGSRRDNPVNCVSSEHAQAYCAWAGTRLPTDDEWEYAARGDDGRAYPWGDDESPHNRARWFFDPGVTTDVGSYPRGMSPFGVMDMAGNVQEWTADLHLRGGGWDHCDPQALHASVRRSIPPDYVSPMTGFRCAADASAGGEPVDPNPGGCVPGFCPPNQTCDEGCRCKYVTCETACCGPGEVCADGVCCRPDCAGRVCGPDPACGVSCGLCTGGTCSAEGQCEDGPCPAGMELVPAGSFQMGYEEGWQNERPVHEVQVAEFCLDRTEVTVADFAACVQAGDCTAPAADGGWWDWSINYHLDGKDDHPMNTLEHVQAEAYCSFAGKRLPTEEEWAYAARGPDSLAFPWGDDAPWGRSCVDRSEGTCPVGSFVAGMSPFGLLDMIGNANEWTASPYCLYSDPGCDDDRRVQRGANWLDSDLFSLRVSKRRAYEVEGWSVNKGVRCAL
ncbi:MAG: SUMF1/EgtB/PvdO family nonheme iron enzyme [Deltaproteobacteria bacterium]|nr:SUMF1/EgtB/PvdO family nonheme iron enzyme [Deltaproteobacteria bacterium]MBW2531421.1 SUMF1/EgtB/PvdO family nonheme iron enzyme [Deltaproteobacteria bacterium]